VRRLSTQGELDAIIVLLRRLVSALLLKFSSTSCVGPRGLRPKRFAESSVTSNVLVQVIVEPLMAQRVRGHTARIGGVLGSFVSGANSVLVNYVAPLRVTSNVLVQVPVQPLVAPLSKAFLRQ